MIDDATQNQDEAVDDQVTDQVPDDQVTPSQTDDQTQDQQVEPAWKSRYQSPEAMFEDVRKFQSDADRYKRQVDDLQEKDVPQDIKQSVSKEEFLEQLVDDPLGTFDKAVTEKVAPVMAQVALMQFAQSGRPEVLEEEFRREMAAVAKKNPYMLATEEGVEATYLYVKNQRDGGKLKEAAITNQRRKEEVERVKRTDAFVESSTPASRQKTPIFTPGMSTEEKDKALDEAGIGWIQDEDRHKFD
jgi:hypothetical protein